jgi:hypothetical protein
MAFKEYEGKGMFGICGKVLLLPRFEDLKFVLVMAVAVIACIMATQILCFIQLRLSMSNDGNMHDVLNCFPIEFFPSLVCSLQLLSFPYAQICHYYICLLH